MSTINLNPKEHAKKVCPSIVQLLTNSTINLIASNEGVRKGYEIETLFIETKQSFNNIGFRLILNQGHNPNKMLY